MSPPSFPALLVGAALSAAALPALAVTCYEVLDRNNNLIFRDVRSPVDLSEAGQRARDAMRNRGEQLVIFDVETCIVIGRTTASGTKSLTVDEIVAEWQAFAGTSSWGTYSSRFGGSPGLAQGATLPARAPSSSSRY